VSGAPVVSGLDSSCGESRRCRVRHRIEAVTLRTVLEASPVVVYVAPEVGQCGDTLEAATPVGAGVAGDVVVVVRSCVRLIRVLSVNEQGVVGCGTERISYTENL